MRPRDYIISQIKHKETKPVPYTFSCEEEVAIKLNKYYGLEVYESVQPEAAGMNPFEFKKKWGDRITLWGCLGSQSIIPFGTPDEIRSHIRKLCIEVGKGGGFIIAPAKPLQPETPLENAVAILEAFIGQDAL